MRSKDLEISWEVQGLQRKSAFKRIGFNALYMRRTMSNPEDNVQTIAYTGGWCLFQAATSGPTAAIQTKSGSYSLPSACVVFVPPYSLVHWVFPEGELTYEMFYSLTTPPSSGRNPTVFHSSFFTQTEVASASFDRIFNSSKVELDLQTNASAIGRRVREAIALTFDQDLSLADIARSLNIAPAILSRTFKRDHRIAPVQYRNLLRMMRAQELLLLRNLPVVDTAFDAGFADLAHFNRQFKQYAKCPPSSYQH